MTNKLDVLGHGFVELLNISGPVRRPWNAFDASDRDPPQVARQSFDNRNANKTEAEDSRLAKYLYRDNHSTPIQMIEVWLEMKMPIFVARQFIRHRSAFIDEYGFGYVPDVERYVNINEVSARYTKLENCFYIPRLENIGVKPENMKQGRCAPIWAYSEEELDARADFTDDLVYICQKAYFKYEQALESGIPEELARTILPVNVYTKWVWKQDLWNMLHFLKLRLDGHTQLESREYAKAIKTLLNNVVPEHISFLGV